MMQESVRAGKNKRQGSDDDMTQSDQIYGGRTTQSSGGGQYGVGNTGYGSSQASGRYGSSDDYGSSGNYGTSGGYGGASVGYGGSTGGYGASGGYGSSESRTYGQSTETYGSSAPSYGGKLSQCMVHAATANEA